jgi:beta-lactamase class D
MNSSGLPLAGLVLLTLSILAPVTVVAAAVPAQSCFLLYEIGVGELLRDPAEACGTAVSPGATFKIPHALAALESGVITDAGQSLQFDGTGQWPESARRDHTLASAMQHSVTWYFEAIAAKLGLERERIYLQLYDYGNKDPGRDLRSFWSGGSLRITPEQQLDFLFRFYQGELQASSASMTAVRQMLVQPAGVIVTAAGERTFGSPWPEGAVVSAQAGNTVDRSGRHVRWLVGHVARDERALLFISCVIGAAGLDDNAAIDLAAKSLRGAEVL